MSAKIYDFATRQPIQSQPSNLAVVQTVPQPNIFVPPYSEDELVAKYLKTHQEPTKGEYARDIKYFREWLAGDSGFGIDLYEVEDDHVYDWKDFQLDTMESPNSTVRRRMTAVDGLYKLATARGWYNLNPFYGVKKPRVKKNGQYTGLCIADVKTLSGYAIHDAELRSRCIYTMLVTTGLRVSELCRAEAEGLHTDGDGKTQLDVIRKGGAEDKVELGKGTLATLRLYLDGRTSGPILLGDRGGPLARQVAWRIIRALGDSALPHLRGRLHPHDMRHTFVSGVLLVTGGDLQEAQWRAAHADMNNTVRYSHELQRSASRTTADLEKAFGLAT